MGYEESGSEYTFKWEYNSPKILCWKSEQLKAIKIDLFYDRNVSFAFDYIYGEDILLKQGQRNSDRYSLTAKNNWNFADGAKTYLEYGYVYFGYHFNVTLFNPLTFAPTTDPTLDPTQLPTFAPSKYTVIINPEQTTTDDSTSNNDDDSPPLIAIQTTEDSDDTFNEQEVYETTNDNDDEQVLNDDVKIPMDNNTDRPLKLLLFGIALAALCSICCIVWCIVWSKRKQNK